MGAIRRAGMLASILNSFCIALTRILVTEGGRLMGKFCKDPHGFILKLGAAVILTVELYKFIKFVIER
jgi:hypothetical protein